MCGFQEKSAPLENSHFFSCKYQKCDLQFELDFPVVLQIF
ncbi:hypothetical protein X975_21514, partial [Stegodyphus mimosarum]